MLIEEWIKESSSKLSAAGIFNAEQESEMILAHTLDLPLGELRLKAVMQEEITTVQQEKADLLIADREDRVPLQHLTGKAPFRTIELEVGPGVFIPRPETEIVTQFAIDELNADPSNEPLAVDLCTGSGAIALSLAAEEPRAKVFAVEQDDAAYDWAKLNVDSLGDGRVTLMQADAAKENPALMEYAGKFTVVISNPPYVPSEAIPLEPEARDHDPQKALYSGEDGLEMIRSLARVAKPLLKPGGLIVLEHAEYQGASVRSILAAENWKSPSTHQDLTRRDRVTIARA